MTGTLTINSSAADGQGSPTQGILFIDSMGGNTATPWTAAAIYTVGSTNWNGSLVFATDGDNQSDFGVTEKMRLDQNGNLGVGTASPNSRLEVNGNVTLTHGSGAQMTFQDGSIQTVAWNGILNGQDYAESIEISGDRAAYEPGDLIIIDVSAPELFARSAVPYSKLVAGVYSTKPGLLGRRNLVEPPGHDGRIPMAMMGMVPTKVSTENGAIEPGDLLVSSSTPGYAMRGTDRDRLVGAVIGKALEPMKSGSGVITALISLQ